MPPNDRTAYDMFTVVVASSVLSIVWFVGAPANVNALATPHSPSTGRDVLADVETWFLAVLFGLCLFLYCEVADPSTVLVRTVLMICHIVALALVLLCAEWTGVELCMRFLIGVGRNVAAMLR